VGLLVGAVVGVNDGAFKMVGANEGASVGDVVGPVGKTADTYLTTMLLSPMYTRLLA
jgi:hypothetical protein